MNLDDGLLDAVGIAGDISGAYHLNVPERLGGVGGMEVVARVARCLANGLGPKRAPGR